MYKKLIAISVISLMLCSGMLISAAAIPTDDSKGSGQKLCGRTSDSCSRSDEIADNMVGKGGSGAGRHGSGCGTVSVFDDGNQSGPFQKLFNRLCDMIGWCRGTGLTANLVNISGELEYNDSNFFIDDAELHFGPTWYIQSTESTLDFDDDGVNESVFDELQGLVGTNITVGAHEQSDGWYSVFTINGEVYRQPGVPIWAGTHTHRWRNNQPTN